MNKQERDELREILKLPLPDSGFNEVIAVATLKLYRDKISALLDRLDAYESVVEAAREWAATTEGLCLKSVKKEDDLDKRELLKSSLQSSRQTIKALEGLEDEK